MGELVRMPESFSLDELGRTLSGNGRELSEEEKSFVQSVRSSGVLALEEKEYVLTEPFVIDMPLQILGGGCTLRGEGCRTGLLIRSSDVEITGMTFRNFTVAVYVDGNGKTVENVSCRGNVIHMEYIGFMFCSSKSGSVIRNLTIEDNMIYGLNEWEQDEGVCPIPFNGEAAKAMNGDPTNRINDCLLENVTIRHNMVLGNNRLALNIAPHYVNFTIDEDIKKIKVTGNFVRNIRFLSNECQCCWDSPINIMGGTACCTGCGVDGIEIAGNSLGFGISGAYLHTGEPVHGFSDHCFLRNVSIHDNYFHRAVENVGEPSRGIFLSAGRLDYYEYTGTSDCVFENAEIFRNRIEGAGIVLSGVYCMLDGRGVYGRNNVLRGVKVHDNEIINADYAFIVEAASMEGRRRDWYFGFPRHDKVWAEGELTADDRTVELTGNAIEDLTITHNRVYGYRYKLAASGAHMRGHGIAGDNKVTKNIVFADNVFENGENHVKTGDWFSEDHCTDAGGNEAAEVLKRV